MKSILLIILAGFFLQVYGQDSLDFASYLKFQHVKCIGKDFPVFKVKNSDSTYLSNLDFVNHIVFINFWFEQCAPCIAELEGLNKMFDSLKDKKDFLFMSFTFDDQETINRTRKKYNIKYKVVHIDKPECYRLNCNNGFPTSLIIDKKTKIVYSISGAQIDQTKASQEILSEIYPKILARLSP